jgi:hypothetical protein
MGLCAGSLTEQLATDRERDYRSYESTPGLKELEQFVDEVREAWGEGESVDPCRNEIDVHS